MVGAWFKGFVELCRLSVDSIWQLIGYTETIISYTTKSAAVSIR